MFLLPEIPNLPRFTFDIDLESTPYRFEFQWNDRDSSWYMSLFETDNTPILLSKRVSLTSDLFSPRGAKSPPGELHAVDTGGALMPPAIDELGNRVVLVYLESTEL